MLKKGIDVTSFTAEPGKIYYFAANITVSVVHGAYGSGASSIDFGLSQLDDDAGKFRVKAWKLATSTPKK